MKNVEIIQQWQLFGLHPRLLEDDVLESCQKAGITSLESYVLWKDAERKKGKFDWSGYDILVEKLKKHNLKWVPFLILGPNYSLPEWFLESEDSFFFKCLEHQMESGNQSIWNPYLPKYIETFLERFSEHYGGKGILESILLGVSGNWGEAIYPAGGIYVGNFHTHFGFWCGDKHALESLKSSQKSPPFLRKERRKECLGWLMAAVSKLPRFIKSWLKIILRATDKRFLSFGKTSFQTRDSDFVGWYLDSMLNWAEFWLKTARKFFPEEKIYLVTGGDGDPISGADFARQTKLASKYNAGIRITNQSNDYSQSFILTRLVSSAAKFYKGYFTTEEGPIRQTKEGVVMRIFDAATSGAQGLYSLNFVSVELFPFSIRPNLPLGQLTPAGEGLKENLHHLKESGEPVIKTAVFFPNTSIILKPDVLTSLYNRCAKLRDILDFDLIDETMIKDGALQKYENLLVLEGELPKNNIPSSISIIYSPKEIKNEEIDDEHDGIYTTRFKDKIMYYNSTNKKIKKNTPFLKRLVEIEPNSITLINI